jgi:uncharacterized membrane protein YphA (DoxX/SURF4 family)
MIQHDQQSRWKAWMRMLIPAPHILTPFVSGVEFFGGIFLLLGLLTRVSAGALGITMVVAIAIAIAGAGRFSIDRLLNRPLRA